MLETNKIYQGDCIEELKKLPDNSVDAIITDPPYGIGFMGKTWDKYDPTVNKGSFKVGTGTHPQGYVAIDRNAFYDFSFKWAVECLRVLKPGGFLLSFGGTRTYHRMTCGIEDAGFEIRDCIMWIYGSGFPKSLNIGKQIDKIQGNEREVVFKNPYADGHIRKATGNISDANDNVKFLSEYKLENGLRKETKGTSEWEGWGTALKPAVEPIVVARKPLSEKNVALNVLKWGTGGINIDECRIGSEPIRSSGDKKSMQIWKEQDGRKNKDLDLIENTPHWNQGRFPANIILDEEAGQMLDEQSGMCKTGNINNNLVGFRKGCLYGDSKMIIKNYKTDNPTGASRFFYVAKASKSERNNGCEEFEDKQKCPMSKESRIGECINASKGMERFETICKNNHPTVKPIKLMEYLIKLVSKENAVILDPFLGSGTTAIACLKTNRKFIGIEKESDYVKIAEARIKPYLSQQKLI